MPTLKTIKHDRIKQQPKPTDNFYHTSYWRNLTAIHRRENPCCEYCSQKGITRVATLTDHYLPRRLFPELQYERSNFRSCCDTHHARKRYIESKCFDRDQTLKKIQDAGFN